MELKPIRPQVVFKPLPSDEISEHGLFIPETAREISNKGVIVKSASGKLKEGTVAYRVKDWGTEVIENGELYFLMDEKAIIAIE